MKRFYEIDIHPRNGQCPIGLNDCNTCGFCKHIGTLGGEYYVDCDYENN